MIKESLDLQRIRNWRLLSLKMTESVGEIININVKIKSESNKRVMNFIKTNLYRKCIVFSVCVCVCVLLNAEGL
jgi:hypothetical protein